MHFSLICTTLVQITLPFVFNIYSCFHSAYTSVRISPYALLFGYSLMNETVLFSSHAWYAYLSFEDMKFGAGTGSQ